MIILGLTQGMQPIAGYNYGARNYERLNEVLILTIKYATIVCIIGFALCFFFPGLIARAFTSDEELLARSVHNMRIYFITFPIIGFQVVTSNFFQSIGIVKKSIFLSLTRQLIFLLPPLLIFPLWWGCNGVWYAIPTSDILATFTTAWLLYLQLKFFKKNKQRI